jgi:hypothetical protein
VQSVPITIKVVSSNPVHGDCVHLYLIQHYVIKFVSDLRQVGGTLTSNNSPYGVTSGFVLLWMVILLAITVVNILFQMIFLFCYSKVVLQVHDEELEFAY